MRIWVGGNNATVRRRVASLLTGTSRPADGPLDAAIITPLTWDEACYFLEKLIARLTPDGTAWIVELSTAPSVRRDLDAGLQPRHVQSFTTVSPDPALLAHGYRRPTS